jgi:osmotically-inducible protein OsmY
MPPLLRSSARRSGWPGSALILAMLVGCAPTATREGTGEYIDDTVITTKVKAALLGDPQTKVLQVNVETFKGVVQLSGFVESQPIASRAVEVARGVKGVAEVKNDMRLR